MAGRQVVKQPTLTFPSKARNTQVLLKLLLFAT
jgi:hypothetical protein